MLDRPQLVTSQYHQLPDGKRIRYAIFAPEATRGTLVVAAGRREFIEKKYAELGAPFLKRGLKLIFFEWRGQGLSDRLLEGARRQRDHALNFDLHLNDLDSFFRDVVVPVQSGPLLITGHSMGAHLILRWLVERQKPEIKGAILTAPMLALSSGMVHATARALCWTALHLGRGDDYAAAQNDYGGNDCLFKGNPLTHDEERFAIMEKYFLAYPDLTVGGVTWSWLDAALRSIHRIQHRKYFDQCHTPLLTMVGAADRVTPTLELVRFLKRIPEAETIILPNALHDVMNETDGIRIMAWGEIDRFLERIYS